MKKIMGENGGEKQIVVGESVLRIVNEMSCDEEI